MIHKVIALALIGLTSLANGQAAAKEDNSWRIDSGEEWNGASRELNGLNGLNGLAIENNTLSPTGKEGTYHSKLQRFKKKRTAQAITLTASTRWDNWEPTEKKVCPPTLGDAPIFLAKGPNDYWILGRHRHPSLQKPKRLKNLNPNQQTKNSAINSLPNRPNWTASILSCRPRRIPSSSMLPVA